MRGPDAQFRVSSSIWTLSPLRPHRSSHPALSDHLCVHICCCFVRAGGPCVLAYPKTDIRLGFATARPTTVPQPPRASFPACCCLRLFWVHTDAPPKAHPLPPPQSSRWSTRLRHSTAPPSPSPARRTATACMWPVPPVIIPGRGGGRLTFAAPACRLADGRVRQTTTMLPRVPTSAQCPRR